MDTISNIVTTECSSKWSWSTDFSFAGLCWSYYLSPLCNGIVTYNFHTSNYITWKEWSNISKEWLSLVFSIKLLCSLLCKSRHLQFSDIKSTSIYSINDFTGLSVYIWLNQSKCSLTLSVELWSCEDITVVNELKLSIINSNDRSNIKILNWESLWFHSLQEHSFVLQIIHFNCVVLWIEC